ncbi:MAG TPA: hypothetical protein VMU81_28135 [Acetobacteraceae bacterium]|nr:hypothetical protein [Acetobacteraceae bacterium]
MAVKAFVSWSSGKDSAFALTEMRRSGMAEIVGVLTTLNEAYDRVAMHGVRNSLLDRQTAALGLPCLKVPLPNPCPMAAYEARMAEASATMKAQGVNHVVFGDLFLEDVRAYREANLARVGMTGLFPLWGRDTRALAEEMIAEGLVAYVACLDPKKLDRSFAGRRFDRSFLAGLPPAIDPCGERGEFHTAVTAGPMFRAPIAVTVGEVVERDAFVFTDIIPAE